MLFVRPDRGLCVWEPCSHSTSAKLGRGHALVSALASGRSSRAEVVCPRGGGADYPERRGRVRSRRRASRSRASRSPATNPSTSCPASARCSSSAALPTTSSDTSTVGVTHGHLDHMAGLAHYASRRRRLAGLTPGPRLRAGGGRGARRRRGSRLREARERPLRDRGRARRARRPLRAAQRPGADRASRPPPRSDGRIPLFRGPPQAPRRSSREGRAKRSRGCAARASRSRGARRSRSSPTPATAARRFSTRRRSSSRARVLLIECSFLFPEDRERAREYAHIHLDDVLARADDFENEAHRADALLAAVSARGDPRGSAVPIPRAAGGACHSVSSAGMMAAALWGS